MVDSDKPSSTTRRDSFAVDRPHSSHPLPPPHVDFGASGHGTSFERLAEALQRSVDCGGACHFIQLHDSPLDESLIDHRPAELLGTRMAVDALLMSLLPAAVRGDIHFRLTSRNSNQIRLTVFSTDFTHQACYRLWLKLPYMAHGRFFLASADLLPYAVPVTRSISRLPICIEAAIQLHRLATQRRPLTASDVQDRIESYARHACGDSACPAARWFQNLQAEEEIDDASLTESRQFLESRLRMEFGDGRHFHYRSAEMKTSRPSAVCFCGSDGVGKTTLVKAIARNRRMVDGALCSQRLYSKSWAYRWMARRSPQTPAMFDAMLEERHRLAVFLRASTSLTIRLAMRSLRRRGTLLIDRCLADFLFRSRTSDAGAFHPRAGWLLNRTPVLPSIQLVASHETTQDRKPAMTEVGHDRYNAAMLRQLTSRSQFDHLVFHNGRSTTQSLSALTHYLNHILGSLPGRPSPPRGLRMPVAAIANTVRAWMSAIAIGWPGLLSGHKPRKH